MRRRRSIVAAGGGLISLLLVLTLLVLALPSAAPSALAAPGAVRLNQTGYLPNTVKRASIVSSSTSPLSWQVTSSSGSVVASGNTTVFGHDAASGDHVHIADFSSLTTPGTGYVLQVGSETSFPFEISADIYHQMKYDALAYFYHNRSGIEITSPYAGRSDLTRPAGHIGVSPNQGDTSVPCAPDIACSYALDVTGGWYDAGDHGKYVVNGGISLWTMLNQYERARYLGTTVADLGDGTMNIPENGNGVPDILDEARWQMEFMLKMQVPDGEPLAGMAHHKMHDENWTGLPMPPHEDPQARYLRPPSTAATLNLAATAAQCARIWETIDPSFADQCLTAAEKAWSAAQANPSIYASSSDGSGGGSYSDGQVSDEFYWAAAELYITTGQDVYRNALTSSPHYRQVPASFSAGEPAMTWATTQALGTISLAVVPNNLGSSEISAMRNAITSAADTFINVINSQGYGTPLDPPSSGYPWGSNSFVLNNAVVMALAHDFTGNATYLNGVSESIDYILGRNAMDQSYVTGYGEVPLQNPHHRFWANQLDASYPSPPPGVVSGGPNSGLQDSTASSNLSGCEPQKCFMDDINAWSVNEITINWNAPFAWVIGWLDEHGDAGSVPSDPDPTPTTAPSDPTPTTAPSEPTPTSAPVSGDLKVQYRAADTNAADNQIKPHLNIVNSGSSSVPLSELTVRYWYTNEGNQSQSYWCDWAQLGCANISGSFVQVSGEAYYLELSFSSGAGSIAAGGQSGELQNRLAKTDWSNYDESDDYSFDPTKTAFADWERITLYRNGTLVWGIEPGGAAPPPSDPTPTTAPSDPTPTTAPGEPTPTAAPDEPTPTPPPPGERVANPYVGAQGYINPDYAAQIQEAAEQTGGTLGAQMAQVANYPTAVWMDRIAAITEGRGLQGHLNAALAQQTSDTPVLFTVVIYNLPNRDCAALASNGELLVSEDGINRYRTEYIDPIIDILNDPKYASLRIVAVVEPDSLPNLVTNTSEPKCAEAQETGAYETSIQYAVDRLNELPNTYIYLDIAHSGWLGWDNNRTDAIQLYTDVVRGTQNGLNSIDGFVTNVANYTPAEEPHLDPDMTVGGQPLRSANFYEWNPYFDEVDFTEALYNGFVQAGFPTSIGMLIDTSRNGWGGANRPSEASGSTANEYVESGRIDRRLHRGNWCNQAGAGIGERPQSEPYPHLDAYVWVKPPGESDGISEPTDGPNEEGKQHDPMCDPNYTADNGYQSGALDNAPHAGQWFPQQFEELVQNAYPPLEAAGNTPPSASITSPADGANFEAPATITIEASASDSDGTVASVAFYAGSTRLGSDTAAPYSLTWNDVPTGSYNLTVVVTDDAGATTVSASVNITVSHGPTPTSTPAPDEPTPTPTPTEPTSTPTSTPSEPTPTSAPSDPGSGDLTVQYRAADTNAADNQIKPHLNIVNSGSSSVPLSELTVRYWYTNEGNQSQSYWCDWAQFGCANVSGSFVRVSGEAYYLELSFSSGAGSVAAGGQSGEIQNRFAKTDWSNYDESDDYSFDPTKTAFADWERVTLYRNGTLVWGIEPGGAAPAPSDPTPTPAPSDPTPTATPTDPNDGGGSVPSDSNNDDWLHVEGNRIVDAAGNPVWLTGANWFGFNASERVFHGLWSANIEDVTRAMAERGINIVRVPISTQLLHEWQNGQAQESSSVNTYANPELEGMTTLEVFDYWLALCKKYGIKVMIDVHSAEADNSGHFAPMWYTDQISPDVFYATWEWIAERYKNDDTIVAMDIENEPHGSANQSPRAKWDGSTDRDNWKHACETAGRRILATNPNLLILCEGIEIYPREGVSWSSTTGTDYHSTWWGGNLRGVADYPVDLGANQDQLVYSPHDYGPLVHEQPWFQGDFDKESLTNDVWRPNWFYIHEQNTAPLLIGEWGGRLGQDARQDKWMFALRDFMTEHKIHQTFWCINPNSGDTGGLLLDDWETWDEEKYNMLKPALWAAQDGRFVSLDHQVPLGGSGSTTGTTVTDYYASGNPAPVGP